MPCRKPGTHASSLIIHRDTISKIAFPGTSDFPGRHFMFIIRRFNAKNSTRLSRRQTKFYAVSVSSTLTSNLPARHSCPAASRLYLSVEKFENITRFFILISRYRIRIIRCCFFSIEIYKYFIVSAVAIAG